MSPSGDLALTETQWRDYSQQAFVSMMTNTGDFTLYPQLGADLEKLIGLPQTPETGEYGKQLIADSLSRNPKFNGLPVSIKAIPTGFQSIRFDVYVTAGSNTDLVLSIEQNIGLS